VSVRIAMWSGPRNISTALMRSWEARGDTEVIDEPFYAAYLARTGLDHPGREIVLASQENDWQRVIPQLRTAPSAGFAISYQKHMAHHFFEEMEGPWLEDLRHAFLIRAPEPMIASLSKVLSAPTLEATGLPQQVAIFERWASRMGRVPPVIDAEDVLRDPAGILSRLCNALDVPWTTRMLSWPAGRRATDGTWAPFWYQAVERSTGFDAPKPRDAEVPSALRALVEPSRRLYAQLAAHKI